MQLDATDLALLSALSENARMSVSTIARRIGLARTTVQARLERLEKTGVIAGYALRLGAAARANLRATVLLQVDPKESATVMSRLNHLAEAQLVQSTSGHYDLIVELAAETTQDLDRALEWIGGANGVLAVDSLIHLATKLDRRA